MCSMRQGLLLPLPERPLVLIAERGDARYWPEFLDPADSAALAEELRATTHFHADYRMMYGRRVAVPRETAARGDRMPQPWTPRLLATRDRIAALLGTWFDYVFVNRYRDGRDSVAWHGDREAEHHPVIASLSLGATRRFDFRPKTAPDWAAPRPITLELADGDLVVMAGETQQWWEHRVRKDPAIHEERLNLTFRQHHPTAVPAGKAASERSVT
jgi:alkylated DNA repair dioxygenase AlkB